MDSLDALIIGGGPAGSTLGLLLARAGWSVGIIEKKAFPRRKVCGEFISAATLSLLFELGIGNDFSSHIGPEITSLNLFADETILHSSIRQHTREFWGRAIAREYLDTILLEHARKAGAKLWQPWKACSLDKLGNIFICHVAAGQHRQEIVAKTVIMAHGSWEPNKFTKIITHKHQSSDLLAFKAHFKNAQMAPYAMPLITFPGGYGGMVKIDDHRLSLSCCIRRNKLHKIRKQYSNLSASAAVQQHITSNNKGVHSVLANAQQEGAWLSAGPLQPGIRTTYRHGIFYVGNLAGEAHPIIANGISMAIQSSWILSKILIKRKNSEGHLSALSLDQAGKEYSVQWQKQFSKCIYASICFATISLQPSLGKIFLPVIKRWPVLLTKGAYISR